MFDKIKGLFKPKPAVSLSIDSILGFLENEFTTEIKATQDRINIIIDDIVKEVSALKDTINELKEKASEDTYANSVKNKFCAQTLEMLEKVQKPGADYKSLSRFLAFSEKINPLK